MRNSNNARFRNYTLTVLLILVFGFVFAQPYNHHKGYNLGFPAHTPTQDLTADDGYVTTGWYFPNTLNGFANPYERMHLVKLDSNKTKVWANVYVYQAEVQNGVLDVEMKAHDVKELSTGDFITAGQVVETNPQNNQRDAFAFLMKTDQYGNVLWFQKYFKNGVLNSVIETQNNGYLACGYEVVGTGETARLLRVRPNGNPYWLRRLNGIAGFTGESAFREVAYHSNKKYVVVGNCNTKFTACGPDASDVLFATVDENPGIGPANVQVWHYGQTVNNNQINVAEFGNSIAVDGIGRIVIGGHTHYLDVANCIGTEESLMIRINFNGNILNAREFDADFMEMGRDVVFNSGNNEIAMVGISGPDAYILITDLALNYNLMEKFNPPGSPTIGTCLEINKHGNYTFMGNTDIFGLGYHDIYQVEQIRVPKDTCHDWYYQPPSYAVTLPQFQRSSNKIPRANVPEVVVAWDIPVIDTTLCDTTTATANSSIPTITWKGLNTIGIGSATVSLAENGGLQVTNIGSSGEDGFEVDLGESEAVSITIGGTGGDDSYASYELMGVAVGNPGNSNVIETLELIGSESGTIMNFERPAPMTLMIYNDGNLVQEVSDFNDMLELQGYKLKDVMVSSYLRNKLILNLGQSVKITTPEGTVTGNEIECVISAATEFLYTKMSVRLGGFSEVSGLGLEIGKRAQNDDFLFFHQTTGNPVLSPMSTPFGNVIRVSEIGPDGTDGIRIGAANLNNPWSVEIPHIMGFDEGDAMTFIPQIGGQEGEEYTGLEFSPNPEGFFDVFVFTNGFVIDIFERFQILADGEVVADGEITDPKIASVGNMFKEFGLGTVEGQTGVNGFFDVFTEFMLTDGSTVTGNEIRILMGDGAVTYTGLEITAKDVNQNGLAYTIGAERVMTVPILIKGNNGLESGDKIQETRNENQATVYPTIFTTELNVDVQSTENQMNVSEITLTDMNGKVVRVIENRKEFDNPTVRLNDLGSLQTGMYFLTVRFENEQRTYKVIKH